MSSIKELRDLYFAKTAGSRRIYERAKKVLPGGAGRGATAFTPYPLYGGTALAGGLSIGVLGGRRDIEGGPSHWARASMEPWEDHRAIAPISCKQSSGRN